MSAPARRRYAKRVQPSERRDQILDATLKLIVERGQFSVTIDAIAGALDVTRPVIYDYFANRDHILDALLERELTASAEALAAVVQAPVSAELSEPDDLLRQRLIDWLELVRANPETWKLILTPPDGIPVESRHAVLRGRENTRERLAGLLNWWLEERGGKPLGAVELETISTLIQAVTARAGELVLEDPERFPPEHVAALVLRLLPMPRRRVADPL